MKIISLQFNSNMCLIYSKFKIFETINETNDTFLNKMENGFGTRDDFPTKLWGFMCVES